jgi:hypothetical protein
MFRFLFLLVFPLPLMAQVDQRKLDSLSRHIDSSQKALRHWQDSFTKHQDSVYNTQLRKEDRQNSQALPQENEKKIKSNTTVILILITSALILLVIIWWYRRRR